MSEPFTIDVPPGSSTLVLGRTERPDGVLTCSDLLTIEEPANESVLMVCHDNSTDDCVTRLKETLGEMPARVGVIEIADLTRSTAAQSTFTPVQSTNSSLSISVSDNNLVEIALLIKEYIEGSESGNCESSGRQLVVCFDSVTGLLQDNGLQETFRFLHVLIGMLKTIDAVAHFHIDPSLHSDHTVSTLRPLFDAIREIPKEH